MNARLLPQNDYLALKAATRQLVKAAGGGSLAAGSTRVRQQELSNYGNASADHGERFMPIDIVADLEVECGVPVVTRALAEMANCLLVPLPDRRDEGALLDLTGKSAREIGALTQEIIQAVADGQVTLTEGQPICAHIRAIAELLLALGEQVKMETERGRG